MRSHEKQTESCTRRRLLPAVLPCFAGNLDLCFGQPGALALGTFRGLAELVCAELKTALFTSSGRNGGNVIAMFETFEKVLKVGRDVVRSFAHQPCDLRNGKRIIQQQRDQIFAEHPAAASFAGNGFATGRLRQTSTISEADRCSKVDSWLPSSYRLCAKKRAGPRVCTSGIFIVGARITYGQYNPGRRPMGR